MLGRAARISLAWLATVIVLSSSLLFSVAADDASPQRRLNATSPNVVLILTDDQRWDTLWSMPYVQAELVGHGATFSNAFVVNSLCCPSRTSIFTGQYSHGTRVYKNEPPNGGFKTFKDASTIATWLHDAGYHTGLIGKYLNGYSSRNVSYIPPGWDRWFSFTQKKTGDESAYYYNYTLSDQGSAVSHGATEADYSTDVFAGQADAFIRAADPAQPLFLHFSPPAPHSPATTPPRYAGSFSTLPRYRPVSYNEADVSDKPAYIKALKKLTATQRNNVDSFRINQYRTLLAVDDAVNTIVAALSDTGRLANTMIIFASDNGLTWAEHRWQKAKLVPYEESIRIPLVIRYDPLTSTARTDDHLALNIDFAPTIAELAGVSDPGAEGMSLMPVLAQDVTSWRQDFLIEHVRASDVVPTYCAVRDAQYLFTTYGTGEQELYDLSADPYELNNQISNPAYADTTASLRVRDQELCSPVPPGFLFPYDVLHPSTPTGLSATCPLDTECDLSWLASTDNVGVTGYTIYRDGSPIATVGGGTLSYADTTVSAATSYTYTVDAFDAAGNHSPQSDPVGVTTQDTQAPSAPTGLSGVAASSSEVDLSWLASTDNVGVTGYTIYRDDVSIGTVDGSTLSFVDTSVAPETTYVYTVDAFDLAGNHSAPSDPVTVTTPP
jgi:N-acetylglucosamine-6-sulfatase